MRKVVTFLILSIFTLMNCRAQTEGQDLLSSFSVYQQGDNIMIILTIEAGTSSCQGIDLERKVGSGEFQVIAAIPGLCGGSEFEETYILKDENPQEGEQLQYRVNLGNVGRSDIVQLYFIPLEEGIALYPNPAQSNVNILLDKELGQECDIEISNSSGQQVFFLEGWIYTSISISCESWSKGIYTVKIRSTEEHWTKQFVVN
jgi:Secretion system C-terminal sorting domain